MINNYYFDFQIKMEDIDPQKLFHFAVVSSFFILDKDVLTFTSKNWKEKW